jgi:multidrug efflux pump subunit AcrA (membrane-fusion protein)
MKKIIPLLLTTVVVFSGCASTASTTNNKANQAVKSNSVPQEIYIFAGKVQANNSVNLTSKISAKVSQLNVDVGSQVNAGDTIVTLDTEDIQAQVNQAEAAVQTAQANLAEVQNSSRPEQIASAQAVLEGAQKAYELAQTNDNREKQLVDSGADPQAKLDAADGTLASAKAQYESAQQQLQLLQSGASQQQVDAAAAAVKQAQAAVQTAQTSLSYGVITTPISGTVTAKNINVGEMASPGQMLVTIVNNNQLHVDGYIPTDLLSQIKVGQAVDVKVSNVGDKIFEGEISVIDTQIDSANNQVLVKVTLKDGSDVLKPGMFAEIGLKK